MTTTQTEPVQDQPAAVRKKFATFDAAAFFQALDGHRRSLGITWKKVAAESGVCASTLTRMTRGGAPDLDGLAALAAWSGLAADSFIRADGERCDPAPLATVTTYLYGDPRLTIEAATTLDRMLKSVYEQLATAA